MTLLALGAIFCVLVVIARELRLLRKRRETPTSAKQQPPSDEYKPRIFTFVRSGWAARLLYLSVDVPEWFGSLAAVVIWWKFVLPQLPPQPWIKYPITALGIPIFAFLAVMVVEVLNPLDPLVVQPLEKWMHRHDERVYNRVFSAEELSELESIRNSTACTGTDDIYDSPEVFAQTFATAPRASGLVFAAHFCMSEICNGGFHQFFWNSTGVLAPEAVDGFREIGQNQVAALIEKAMSLLGSVYPRDRGERQAQLAEVSRSSLDALDETYYSLIDAEADGFTAAADRYAASAPLGSSSQPQS